MRETLILRAEKRAFRTRAKALAAAISSEENAAVSAALCGHLARLPAFAAAKTVCCFVGLPDEPDTRPFLKAVLAAGKTLCLPQVRGNGELALCAVPGLEGLTPGVFGILEPPPDARILPPEAIDLCVVPCLAGAPDGHRLGRGGGYYDRLLPRLRPDAVTALACRKALLFPQLPAGAWDAVCTVVVTEEGAL